MKKVIFLFALVMGLAFTSVAQSEVTTPTAEFSVTIDNSTSRTDLLDLKNELAAYGVVFMYNPSFTPDRKLNGIKVRIIDANEVKHEYALNPMTAEDALVIERKNNDEGQLELFVGEKK